MVPGRNHGKLQACITGRWWSWRGVSKMGSGKQRSWVTQAGRADTSACPIRCVTKRFSSSSNLRSTSAPALGRPTLQCSVCPVASPSCRSPEAAPSSARPGLRPGSHPPAPGLSHLPCPADTRGPRCRRRHQRQMDWDVDKVKVSSASQGK